MGIEKRESSFFGRCLRIQILLHISLYVCVCVCVQHHLILDPASSYAVDDLKPDTIYAFSLAARSEKGLGVFTPPVEARTAQSSEYRRSHSNAHL